MHRRACQGSHVYYEPLPVVSGGISPYLEMLLSAPKLSPLQFGNSQIHFLRITLLMHLLSTVQPQLSELLLSKDLSVI